MISEARQYVLGSIGHWHLLYSVQRTQCTFLAFECKAFQALRVPGLTSETKGAFMEYLGSEDECHGLGTS